jgi:hypothetical protein
MLGRRRRSTVGMVENLPVYGLFWLSFVACVYLHQHKNSRNLINPLRDFPMEIMDNQKLPLFTGFAADPVGREKVIIFLGQLIP